MAVVKSEPKNFDSENIFKPKYEYPYNSVNELNPYLLFHAFEYKLLKPSENIMSIDISAHLGTVKLYVPGGITYTINNNYSEESYVLSLGHVFNAIKEKVKEHISFVPQLYQRKSGQAIYPSTVKIYQNTALKSFSISYKFVPRNKAEATEVESIIRFFNYCSLPAKTNAQSKSQWSVKPPALFEIQLGYSGKGQTSSAVELLHYKNMLISNITVTYSPDSESFLIYEDGTPVAISLNLSFDSMTPVEPIERKI